HPQPARALESHRWTQPRRHYQSLEFSRVLSLPLVALAAGLAPPWLLLCAALAGVCLDVAGVTWVTAFQQQVPDDELGRMSAFNQVGERLAVPVGYLVVALFSHAFSDRSVLVVCAAIIVAATALNLCVRDIHRVRRLNGPLAEGS
ncbi:MFS transporter, partial [Streptomyces sp. NPDC005904]|uniref:MFS transporter n=1 Tax=Streptomyces sp. NPDC005904 TaxID=3154570 RepID=UPI0033E6684F